MPSRLALCAHRIVVVTRRSTALVGHSLRRGSVSAPIQPRLNGTSTPSRIVRLTRPQHAAVDRAIDKGDAAHVAAGALPIASDARNLWQTGSAVHD